ncbi:MAG: hypothetical protein ABSE71_03375 [Candidatus Micrarchaeaceae archaeon]|jgi:orotate phosphoribosyltransferase
MATKLSSREALAKDITIGLRQERSILTWYNDRPEGWRLVNGLWSPYYINMRLITTSPKLYRKTGEGFCLMLDEEGYRADNCRLVGVAMAGIPFANAVTLMAGIPSLYTRKLPEDVKTPVDLQRYIGSHGQHALVEGHFESGDTIVCIDDLVTRFDSKLLAIHQVQAEAKRKELTGIKLEDVFVLLDREQGASEKASELGFRLHSLIPFVNRGLGWLRESFSDIEYTVISDYVRDPQKYQDREMSDTLRRMARR